MEKTTCTAFAGVRRVAAGDFDNVVLQVKALFDGGELENILIFDDKTAQQLDADLGGTVADLEKRLKYMRQYRESLAAETKTTVETTPETSPSPKPGRPKLGVVSREVTLLPRHWEWLATQPGGASVAIRKLVDAARLNPSDKEKVRAGQESTYRFMSAMAGNRENFEEASRALFAGERPKFISLIAAWPEDIRTYLQRLAEAAFLAEM